MLRGGKWCRFWAISKAYALRLGFYYFNPTEYRGRWVKCVSRSRVPRWNCRGEIEIVSWTENKRKS